MAIWVVRGGQQQDTVKLFLDTNTVGIQYYNDSVDLMALDKATLKEQILRNYEKIAPAEPRPRDISYFANRVSEFLHEIQVGDIILMPHKRGSAAYEGDVIEGYECWVSHPLPHRRNVRWRGEVGEDPLGSMKGKRLALFKLRD